MKKCLVLCAMLLFASKSFAHEEYITTSQSGNVTASIEAGWELYERRHMQIVAQLADILSQKMGNKESIYIYYKFCSANPESVPKYAINYKTGDLDPDRRDTSDIKIFCYDYGIKPIGVLKLLEYAITNKDKIQREQKPEAASIFLRHQHVSITSMSASTINEILFAPTSDVVMETLASKIYRPLQEGEGNSRYEKTISYYFQNNKYHVFLTDRELDDDGGFIDKEIVVETFDNIFQFNVVGFRHALVFDSYNSFYSIRVLYVSHGARPKLAATKRHIIDDDKSFRGYPYNVVPMGGDRICISTLPVWWSKTYYDGRVTKEQRPYNMVYMSDNDVLIQNADEILDEAVTKQQGAPKDYDLYLE